MRRNLIDARRPFLPDGDGGAGPGTGQTGGAGTGTGTPPGQQQGGNDPAPLTMTQAELDRIIADRVRRAQPADYNDLKAQAAKLAEIEAANATDLDKAVKKATAEAESRVRTSLTTERVLDRAEVLAAKTWADTTDARLRMQARAAAGEFTKQDGSVDVEKLTTAVADELKAAPHLAAIVTGSGRPGVDPAQGSGANGNNASRGAAGLAEAQKRFGMKSNS